MFHLREAHGVPLFFFCKACHLGGTHERTIYAHVAVKSQRCRQFGMQKNWVSKPYPAKKCCFIVKIVQTSVMTIGVCPANVLHYQPKNIVTHEVMVSRGSVSVYIFLCKRILEMSVLSIVSALFFRFNSVFCVNRH